MVLSNAERQARYKAKLKAQAARAANISEGQVEFFHMLRRRGAHTRERIEMLRDGRLGYFEMLPGGAQNDITHEAIAREEAMLAEDERILALYDPDNQTAFEV